MCLVAFAYRTELCRSLGYDLVLIANRDEFFNRPAQAAHFWEDAPSVLAGRDIKGGGTWMGVARDGRFALLTNYRDPARARADAKSRGLLVSDFLASGFSAREYLESVRSRAGEYNGFNLLAGSRDGIFYFSSLGGAVREIEPGLYGMSNHLFETPWPKVVRAKNGLTEALKSEDGLLDEALFQVLYDATPALDHELPKTGVGIERERALSSIFITMPGYGTRCSTLLLMKVDGQIEFCERSFSEDRSAAPSTAGFSFETS
jgi:uncharacterized protein with NRDE domain